MPSVHQHSLCTSLFLSRSSPLVSTTCVVKHNNNILHGCTRKCFISDINIFFTFQALLSGDSSGAGRNEEGLETGWQ